MKWWLLLGNGDPQGATVHHNGSVLASVASEGCAKLVQQVFTPVLRRPDLARIVEVSAKTAGYYACAGLLRSIGDAAG
jgi:hypothetical protein